MSEPWPDETWRAGEPGRTEKIAPVSRIASQKAKTALRRDKRKAKALRLASIRKARSKPRRLSKGALVRKADTLFGQWVRSIAVCESGRVNHAGPFQCAHGFSRRYRATRWDRRNAFCLCAGCHVYFTHRPLEWDEWMRSRMGQNYELVRQQALTGGKQDIAEVISGLDSWCRMVNS